MKYLPIMGAAMLATLTACGSHHDGPHGHAHPHDPAAKARYKFDKMDTNRDGVVTQLEYQNSAQMKWAELDADRNGIVTPAEVEAMEMRKWDEPRYSRPGYDDRGFAPGEYHGSGDPASRMPYDHKGL